MGRILRGYSRVLNKHKYTTQIVTGGVLWFSGDILCQSLVHLASRPSVSNDEYEANSAVSNFREEGFSIDWRRAGRMSLYGLAVSAPAYALWYTQLERFSQRVFAAQAPGKSLAVPSWIRRLLARHPIVLAPIQRFVLAGDPPARLRTWKIIGFKLGMDTFVFDPLYLSLFFTVTSAMEGHGPGYIQKKLREELGTTWLIDVAVWSPIQTFNFRYVPVLYQALVVQSCNIGWNAYLSFVQHRNGHPKEDNKWNGKGDDKMRISTSETLH